MREQEQELARAMRELGAAYRAGVRRRLRPHVLWVALATILALVAIDALLALPAALRVVAAAGFLPGLIAYAVLRYRRMTGAQSFELMVARAAESAHPELDNAIVNAIDFSRRLKSEGAQGVLRRLMEAEVAGAARATVRPSLAERLRKTDARPEARRLGYLCAAFALALALAWPVFEAVAPRFLHPLGDFPPYHPTRLRLEPGRATVQYGDNLNVAVHSRGPRPRGLELVLEPAGGGAASRLPLYESEPGAYLQTIEHITEPFTYYASMERGRSRRHEISIARAPRIDTARVHYEYPAYARLRPETRFLAEPLLRAYAGTRATLLLTANRPLRGGTLRLQETESPLTVDEDGRTARATFVLTEAGSFEATLVDSEGTAPPHPYAGRVEVLPDRPPEISIVEPGVDAFATPDARIAVNLEARDDLGVRRIELFRSLNGSHDYRQTVTEHPGGLPFANAIATFDFADLGVRPGDVVDYYAAAVDSHPDRPHTAASRAQRIMIINKEQYRALMQAQETAELFRARYDDWSAQLRDLADEQGRLAGQLKELRQPAAQGTLDDTGRARLADLEDRQAALGDETAQLAARMAKEADVTAVLDIERDFKTRLAAHAREVEAASRLMRESVEFMKNGRAAPEAGAQQSALNHAGRKQEHAMARLGASEQAYEDTVGQAAREIEELFALYEHIEHFKYLVERQGAVERQARHLARVKTPDLNQQVRLKELADEQAALRTELEDLARRFAEDGPRVREHYPKVADDAQAIADRIAELAIVNTMANAASSFGKLKGLDGHAAAARAHADMLSMVSQCNGANGSAACEARLKIAMNMALGQTFQQLASSLNFGDGQGSGAGYGLGAGRGRGGGMQAAYHVYGDSTQPNASRRSASMGRRSENLPPEPGVRGELAIDTEELASSKAADLLIEAHSEEGPLAEYQRMVDEYFRRMAEE